MTPAELLSNLRFAGAEEPIEIFLYLANHAHELRTNDGQRLNDGIDFAVFLVEFADVLSKNPLGTKTLERAIRSVQETCHVCGHLHEGDGECGVFMGTKVGYCDCKAEVHA